MIPHYVLLIHGIGEEKPGFNRGLKKNIQKRFTHALEELKNSVPSLSHERFTIDSVVVREIVWSDLTQNDQDCLWRRLYPKLPKKRFGWLELLGDPGAWIPRLRYLAFLRQFVLNYFGDPISYVPKGYQYIRIHKRLYDDFNELHKEIQSRQNDERAFVTVVAHSLGSVIASDLIYDMFNKLNGKDWPPQACLANFFTFGSPLALYMLREGVDENNFSSPITMQDQEGLWINIYDRQDILGYPLKNLNGKDGAYDHAVFADLEITAGQWWNPWHWLIGLTPLSHVLYWKDDFVAEMIGRKTALDWVRANYPKLEPDLTSHYSAYREWVRPRRKEAP